VGKAATATGTADVAAQEGIDLVNQTDLDVLAANGVKFTPQNVVATGTTPSGQIVFLETGNSRAGLQHIIENHSNDFASIGVSQEQIPSVVMQAVKEGDIVGYQGSGTGRPIYQTTINGQTQRIAVTIGNNGFIVGANPAGSIK
jgi:filamentous hemagglutinin